MGSLDELDAAVLRHALTAIDEWGIDVVSLLEAHDLDDPLLSPPPQSPPMTMDCSRSSAPAAKPSHYIQRKQALLALRAQVGSLQQTLVREQAMRWKEPGESTVSEHTQALQREGKAIATRQYQMRFVAQMRNYKLHKLLEKYRRDARKIERLGRRMLSLEESLPRSLSFSSTNFDGPREDPQIQLLRLPGLQHEAQEIFTSGAFAEHRSDRIKTFREVVLRDSRATTGVVEVVFETAWVLPYAMDDVADALWLQSTRVTTGNNQIQWLDVHVEPSSVVSQFVSVSTDDATPSVKYGQIATNRDRAKDGSVQVVSNVQVKAINGTTLFGLYSSDVWTRVEPISETREFPLSQVFWCRRVRLQQPASQGPSSSERTEWMHQVLSAYTGSLRKREESMLTCNMQAIENLLVSRGAQRKGTRS